MSVAFREEVEYVARLARLSLTPEEKELMAGQLGDILETARRIGEINTEGIEPTAHVLSLPAFQRDDTVTPSLPVDKVLQNAPDRVKSYFRVPSITGYEEA
ncbi:MAG TPA: Asp-tRNA(Asn)/Glu-tRNA(Gln) amidotransferase subunit GatC [Firmicutes bacterium]|nr:Asp-tRNA(Asn)/Glu-tRNA(Gln) amidotransferase subunit GatC [Bacillota bacterium]